MRHIAQITIGEHRGVSRIWIEGTKLISSNFNAGDSIEVLMNKVSKTITIHASDIGRRIVSSRKRKGEAQPIIDICNNAISQVFGTIRKAKAIFSRNKIIITIHPDELAQQERLDRLNRKLANKEPLSCGSMAHGGGIMDQAIHRGLADSGVASFLGFGIEIEPKYLECSLRNNSVWTDDSLAIEAPMQDVNVSDLPLVDILVAGLPCTGASIAGKSKNKLTFAEDHTGAGALFLAFINIMRAANPFAAVLENVPQYASTASMSVIRSALSAMGYVLHEIILNGNEHGALENRDRFVMVAVTKGFDIDLSEIIPVRQKESCLAEVLEPVADDDPMWKEYEYLKEKAIRDKKAGKGFKMQILDGKASSCGVIARGYSKVRSTEIKIQHPTNPDLMRQITATEHARMKCIPEELVAGLSATIAHEVLGQAIIFPAFQAVGVCLGNAIQRFVGIQRFAMSAKAVKEEIVEAVKKTFQPAKQQLSLFG